MWSSSPIRIRLWPALALATALALPVLAHAADTVKKAPAAKAAAAKSAPAAEAPKADAAMAEMMRLGQPGPEHEGLKAMEGTWKAVTKSWTGAPEPMVSEGTSENKMILGGRYLQSHFTGTMMGQPFEGWGLTGFDNSKKQYTAFWVDNSSTVMMLASGTMSGKELTTKATMDGPDGKPTEYRMTTTMVDEKTHVFAMYAPLEGKEQKMMEITYTRQ